uniref:Uncharacterized protein n=1 Tax=Urocitellus parryii TaxID=9999 RepID=A0A8D2KI36_UROPR
KDLANFFLREKVKVNGKTGNPGNVIHIERFKNKISVPSLLPKECTALSPCLGNQELCLYK